MSEASVAVMLHFLVNLFLLAGTNQLAGARSRWIRLLAGAVLGAGYAGLCLMPGFGFLGSLLWRAVSLCLISAVSFGIDSGSWKRGCMFALLSMALGGMALAAGQGSEMVGLLCIVPVWLLSRSAFGGADGRLLPVELSDGGRVVHLTAFHDTGNGLRDPISGERAMVLGASAARELTGLTVHQLQNPLRTLPEAGIPGLRLIPYRAVGTQAGLLLALRLPDVKVGTRRCPMLVALSPTEFEGEAYQALVGGNL